MVTTDQPIARVVGGGFIGLACALTLQSKGYRVELYDAGSDEAAASFGNAGHIAAEQIAPLASWDNVKRLPRALFSRGGPVAFPINQVRHWLPFGVRFMAACVPGQVERGLACNRMLLGHAVRAWRDLLNLMNRPELLTLQGHHLVWESEKTATFGLKHWREADLGSCSVKQLDAKNMREIRQLFASKPVAGLQFSGSGHIRDLNGLRHAMRDAILKAGGIWHKRAVAQVVKRSGLAHLILKEGGADPVIGHTNDLVIVCSGVHSADLLNGDFGALPMIAERGYHIQTDHAALAALTLEAPLVFEDRSLIVTPLAQGLRLASFTEFTHHEAKPDMKKWQRLKSHAADLGIGLLEEKTSFWAGNRPTLPDYLPAIGRSNSVQNLIVACGHNHLGLTLAAVTAQIVGQLAQCEATLFDVSALAPQRYLPNF